MDAFQTSTQVTASGEISVPGAPFAPGTEVEVIVVEKRKSADEFVAAWKAFCQAARAAASSRSLTDEELSAEIDIYRTSR